MAEHDCSNCCYEGKEVNEKPCNTCVNNDNWSPAEAEERSCANCANKVVLLGSEPCGSCGGPGRPSAWVPAEPKRIIGETDPLGTDAHAPGAKLDAGKVLAGVLADFSLALLAVAEVGTHGAEKYSRGGWQSVPDGETRYKDADWRHLLKGRHEDKDPDSGLLHDAHRAWNVLAALELRLRREKGE